MHDFKLHNEDYLRAKMTAEDRRRNLQWEFEQLHMAKLLHDGPPWWERFKQFVQRLNPHH